MLALCVHRRPFDRNCVGFPQSDDRSSDRKEDELRVKKAIQEKAQLMMKKHAPTTKSSSGKGKRKSSGEVLMHLRVQ